MDQLDEMAQQKLEALGGQLKRSIEELNSEFNRNHQPLIGKIKELNDITDELESMHRNTTVGSLVGSSIGVAAGITALAGLVLAPFTFGASLALTTVGRVVGVAGGVTSAASHITNKVKEKNLRENIEKITKDFINTVNPMIQHLSIISNTIEELQQEGQKDPVQNKVIMTSVRSVETFSSVTKLLTVVRTAQIGKVTAKAAETLRVVGKLSGTISALFLAFDVYSIVCDSIKISAPNQSEGERKAENIKSETLKFILQMRETAAQFQETLDEIKSARDTINKELQIK